MNKIYTSEMFNKETKERFLSPYSENTRITYSYVFLRSYVSECFLDKDLYDFDFEEIEDLLKSFSIPSAAKAAIDGSIIGSYINWAIEQGLRNGVNPFVGISPDYYKDLVDKKAKYVKETNRGRLFSEDGLSKICDLCENAQDACIFRLLFEGVGGEAVSELINLKKQDVNFETGVLHLVGLDGEKRELQVSQKAIRCIDDSIQKKKYSKGNGEVSPGTFVSELDIIDSDYVIRPTARKSGKCSMEKHNIYDRIKKIRNLWENEFLTVNNIRKSGMIYVAKQQIDEIGRIDYVSVCKRFGVTFVPSVKEYLNRESVEELYENNRG